MKRHTPTAVVYAHLERQSRANLVLQDLGNSAVEVGQDLHGELGIDVVLRDEVIEGICEGAADAADEAKKNALVSKAAILICNKRWMGSSFIHFSIRSSTNNNDESKQCGAVPASAIQLVEILRRRHLFFLD